jgi:hypothetical protein
MPDAARPLYETESNSEAEVKLGQLFARYIRARFVPIQGDQPHIDSAYLRDGFLVAFSENKQRTNDFGNAYPDYQISERKVLEARKVNEILRVPVYLVVGFKCGTVAYLDSRTIYKPVEKFGRRDRGDALDIEKGAAFKWTAFEIMRHP